MNQDAGNGGSIPPDPRDVEPGEPVASLRELEIEPSAGFFHRLRSDIDRRSLASQVLTLTWYVPRMVLLEFVTIIFSFFRPADERKGDRP